MRSTRTHTRFFTVESARPLSTAIEDLIADWEGRAPYVDSETAKAGRDRLTALTLAAERLTDVAD